MRLGLALALTMSSIAAPTPVRAYWSSLPNANTRVLDAAGDRSNLTACTDGAGGAILAWLDTRGTPHLRMQRILSSGALAWDADGVRPVGSVAPHSLPALVSDGQGGAIVVWRDARDGAARHYAQRVGANGVGMWSSLGVLLGNGAGDQRDPALVSDGANGAIVAWRAGAEGSGRVRAQRVDATGSLQWGAAGVELSGGTGEHGQPRPVADGLGGAFVAWSHVLGDSAAIYARRVSATGTPSWAPVPVARVSGSLNLPVLCADGSGGVIVAWNDYRGGADCDIRAQRLDGAGSLQWSPDGIVVCDAPGDQYWVEITPDGVDGAIVAWADQRSGHFDIRAQRVLGSGSMSWAANGVAVSAAARDQLELSLASDGHGGAFVSWTDWRGGPAPDIYGQHLDGLGTGRWQPDGSTTPSLSKSHAHEVAAPALWSVKCVISGAAPIVGLASKSACRAAQIPARWLVCCAKIPWPVPDRRSHQATIAPSFPSSTVTGVRCQFPATHMAARR